MMNEAAYRAVKERAKQIDPCAFKSYSGSARRDAQQVALEQARFEIEREATERAHTSQQRRYTIDEIDRMRVAIKRVQPIRYGNEIRPNNYPSVEDQVRTAMLGGVSPQELEDKADLHWEAIRERRAVRQRERDAVAYAVHPGQTNAEAIVADAPLNSYWQRIIVSRIDELLSRFGVKCG